jgi:hypothetical protein
MLPRIVSVADISHDIAAAASCAASAEAAYYGDDLRGAQQWFRAADRRLAGVLATICRLTEAQADGLEPSVSAVDQRLLRLRAALFCLGVKARTC